MRFNFFRFLLGSLFFLDIFKESPDKDPEKQYQMEITKIFDTVLDGGFATNQKLLEQSRDFRNTICIYLTFQEG